MNDTALETGKQNRVFLWIAIAAALPLLIPLIAMGFTDEVNWGLGDFLIMYLLIFGLSSLFLFVSRKLATRKLRILAGMLFVGAFVFIWAELAVGVFTSWGD